MQEMNAVSAVPTIETNTAAQVDTEKTEVVSTHVLVAEDQFEKLKELSRRTRIAQSEYLR